MTVRQLEEGRCEVENQYSRVVKREGNPAARQVMERIFEVSDREWRGLGLIPMSGYEVRAEYAAYDAKRKFRAPAEKAPESELCMAGKVLKGIIKPQECPQFGKACTPSTPLGAPMVSSEGACAAYYHYFHANER